MGKDESEKINLERRRGKMRTDGTTCWVAEKRDNLPYVDMRVFIPDDRRRRVLSVMKRIDPPANDVV